MSSDSRTLCARRQPLALASAVLLAICSGSPAAAAGSLSPDAGPQVAQAAPGDLRRFDIPPQPLASALTLFARQAGLQVAVDSALLAGLGTAGVSGSLAPEQALQALLAGSDLAYSFTDPTTVTLARANNGPVRMAPVTVEAVLEGTLTESYRAPDSFSATRTDTPLIDTPQSAQSVTRQALEDAGATTISDAYDYLAGISQENNTGGLTGDDYLARGFETDNILFNGNRTGQPTTLDTANVERIEVLRGPTATLFGRADPGGLINVITKQPLAEPFYEAGLFGVTGLTDAGSRLKGGRATLDSGGPFDADGDVRFRLNSAFDYQQSFRQDIEEKVFLIAPVVEAELDENTAANLEFSYQFRQDSFDRGVFFIGDDLPLDRDFNIAEGQTPSIDRHYGSGTFRLDHAFAEDWTARLGLYASANAFDGKGVQVGSVTGSIATLQERDLVGDDYFFTAQPEIVGEFETGPFGHTLLTGLDLAYQRNYVDLAFGTPSAPFDALAPVFPILPDVDDFEALAFQRDLSATSVGIYAQDQIDLTDDLKLLLGLRWDGVWLTEDTLFTAADGAFIVSDRDETFQGNDLLPRAGIVYQPIEEVALYAAYSETYRPPVAGGLTDVNGDQVDPEESRNFEVGIKLDALDGRLGGTLAVFRSDKKNVLEADPVDFFASVNLGDVRSEGIELDLAGEITENISIGLSYALTDARVSSHDGPVPKNTRLRNVPLHKASVQGAYSFTEGILEGLRVFGGLVFESDNRSDTSDVIRTELPAYVRIDLGATYEIVDGLEASLLVRNLTDEVYYTSAAGRNNVAVGEPLSVTLGVRARF